MGIGPYVSYHKASDSPLTNARLWKAIGEGTTESLAQLATEHYKTTGKPLRIAVDAPHLWYHNVTSEGVQEIRESK